MNYLTGIRLNGFPEQSSYLANLPVVKYLQSLEELAFEKPVTFSLVKMGRANRHCLRRSRLHWALIQRRVQRFLLLNKSITFCSPSVSNHHQIRLSQRRILLRAESFYNTATYLDEHSTLLRYGGVSFHAQSHGESFLSL